jgi:hypothetical protein
MRPIVLTVCVLTAACSDPDLISPISPASAMVAPASTPTQGGAELPFRGSFTLATSAVTDCPPTCPPEILRITGTAEGTATQLGRFTATFVDNLNLATATSTGTFDFTAADGAQLFATTTGSEDQFIPPNVSHITIVAEIVGGTGRFAGATGTFTIHSISTIDFAGATSTGSASFDGQVNLGK